MPKTRKLRTRKPLISLSNTPKKRNILNKRNKKTFNYSNSTATAPTLFMLHSPIPTKSNILILNDAIHMPLQLRNDSFRLHTFCPPVPPNTPAVSTVVALSSNKLTADFSRALQLKGEKKSEVNDSSSRPTFLSRALQLKESEEDDDKRQLANTTRVEERSQTPKQLGSGIKGVRGSTCAMISDNEACMLM
jgi:hypothetical protein